MKVSTCIRVSSDGHEEIAGKNSTSRGGRQAFPKHDGHGLYLRQVRWIIQRLCQKSKAPGTELLASILRLGERLFIDTCKEA